VLPSFSENFGLVVAEALACEVPVITTKGLPWREIQEQECGWWIDTGLEPLVKALRSAFELSDQQRAAKGARGRKLIAKNYTWESAARKVDDVYRWLIDGAGPPDTIRNI
jgi:glycosyltransferase involved in cell wall biosynthesis